MYFILSVSKCQTPTPLTQRLDSLSCRVPAVPVAMHESGEDCSVRLETASVSSAPRSSQVAALPHLTPVTSQLRVHNCAAGRDASGGSWLPSAGQR